MKPANRLFQLFINARLATLLCCSLLVSCGGSGSVTTAGIGGTGISYGAVSGFGSIILNGSHLDDDTAVVTLDGVPGDDLLPHRGLKQGMVVKVSGSFDDNTGKATSVEYRDNLEGPVCDLSTTISLPIEGIVTIRVLGQTVILDATTFVDNSTSSINLLDIVEVSGLPNAAGEIHASFIENKTLSGGATIIEVKGRITDLNLSAMTFKINNLLVSYTSGVIDNSISISQLADGQFVEVKGTGTGSCNTSPQTDSLVASKIELESEGAGDISSSDHAEVEGLVTVTFVELNPPGGPGTFKIGNRQIQTNSTRFLPEGFDSSDLLILGTKVEAEGTSANGVLTATKISFRENVKLESDVATGDADSFTLVGLPNIIITTNSATIIENGVSFISGVSHIRVRGIEGPNNTVLATRIEDRGTSTNVFLQGPVDQVANPSITILGISLDTSGFSDTPLRNSNFENVDEQKILRSKFFDLVQPGTLVKFKGELNGSITWEEAELEDD